MAISWRIIFSTKFRIQPTKNVTRTLFIVLCHGWVDLSLLILWFVIVGRKDTSMANHQKNRVAGSSSCLPISLHFLLLFVNRLETRPMGQGSNLASS